MPSKQFANSVTAPIRQTVANVRFALVAPEAKEIAQITTPAGNAFSRAAQIIDNVTDISARIATFEPLLWRLDGSFVLPLPPNRSDMEVGLWGNVQSDDNGAFPAAQVITAIFPVVQNIKQFGVAFDEPTGVYCKDIEITAYGSDGGVILQEHITDNTAAYAHTQSGAINVYKVEFALNNTNQPNRYLRVSEIDFGVVVNFTGEDIIKLGLVTEANPTGHSFPLSSFNLSIANDGRFGILDSQSYAQYLQTRQTLEYKHGVYLPDGGVDWAYCGAYYLDNWYVSDESVELNASGKAVTLENRTYTGSNYSEKTVGQLAREVLGAAGFVYAIDAALDSSPVISGYFGEVDYRTALSYLSELSCCLVCENQENTIEFTDVFPPPGVVAAIDYENMLEQPKLELATYYNGILLSEYTKTTNTDGSTRLDKSEIFYEAPWRDPLEPDFPYRIDLPMMIITPKYPVFRDWFLTRKFALLNRRISCDIRWRQNPALQVGDTVDTQVDKNHVNFPMSIVRQTIEFNGGVLRGSTKTAGGQI